MDAHGARGGDWYSSLPFGTRGVFTICVASYVLCVLVGFDDFGGTDDFPTEHLRCCLAAKNMLTYEGGDEGSDANPRAQKKSTVVIEKRNLRKGGGTLVLGSEDETSDFSD